MRSDVVPGGVFPDYELPDHTPEMPHCGAAFPLPAFDHRCQCLYRTT